MKSTGELLEKYKNRNLKEELLWAAHYTRKDGVGTKFINIANIVSLTELEVEG